MGQSWTCPYCNRDCTIGNDDIRVISDRAFISKEYGYYQSVTTIIVCPNPNCRQQTIFLNINKYNQAHSTIGDNVYNWQLKPESQAKPFPEFIPEQLRNDYMEACLIKTKSPKASATLSRGVYRE
jgi:hypothetical protein